MRLLCSFFLAAALFAAPEANASRPVAGKGTRQRVPRETAGKSVLETRGGRRVAITRMHSRFALAHYGAAAAKGWLRLVGLSRSRRSVITDASGVAPKHWSKEMRQNAATVSVILSTVAEMDLHLSGSWDDRLVWTGDSVQLVNVDGWLDTPRTQNSEAYFAFERWLRGALTQTTRRDQSLEASAWSGL